MPNDITEKRMTDKQKIILPMPISFSHQHLLPNRNQPFNKSSDRHFHAFQLKEKVPLRLTNKNLAADDRLLEFAAPAIHPTKRNKQTKQNSRWFRITTLNIFSLETDKFSSEHLSKLGSTDNRLEYERHHSAPFSFLPRKQTSCFRIAEHYKTKIAYAHISIASRYWRSELAAKCHPVRCPLETIMAPTSGLSRYFFHLLSQGNEVQLSKAGITKVCEQKRSHKTWPSALLTKLTVAWAREKNQTKRIKCKQF